MKTSQNFVILTQHSASMLVQDKELCCVCHRMGSIGWVCPWHDVASMEIREGVELAGLVFCILYFIHTSVI